MTANPILDDAPPPPRKALPCMQIALVVWGIIVTVIVIRLLRHKADTNSIFKLLYDTGTSWLDGHHLYAEEGTYRYSPGVAAILSLLARVPIRLATMIWLALSLGTFWSGFIYWLRTALPVRRDGNYHAILMLVATPLILGNFNNLQANPICMGAMLATVAATLRKKWLIAAVCIAVATMFKVYPLAMGLVLLVLFPKRLWLAMIVGLLFAALLPFLFQQPDYVIQCYREWVESIIKDQRLDRPLATSYRDMALLWRAYVGPLNAIAYQIITLAGAAAIGVVAALLHWSKKSDAVRSQFLLALVMCWIMLLGPSTESATYMMFGPLVAWMVVESLADHWPVWMKVFSLTAFSLLLSTVLSAAVYSHNRDYLAHGPQPVAALLAAPVCIAWFLRAAKRTLPSSAAFPVD